MGPHPPAPLAVKPTLLSGPARGVTALTQCASEVRWPPWPGRMTYVELALDFEAHAEPGLLAPGDHWLRGLPAVAQQGPNA